VECPRHGSLFDLRTGRAQDPPAFLPVETFEARIQDGEITLEALMGDTRDKALNKEQRALKDIGANYLEKFGFHDSESGYAYKAPKGLSEQVVRDISGYKSEPDWMREFRLKALEALPARPTPKWGGNLGQIDWENIHYSFRASEKNSRSWDEVPDDIKKTFDRSRHPEAERKFPIRRRRSVESEVVYHRCARTSRSRA